MRLTLKNVVLGLLVPMLVAFVAGVLVASEAKACDPGQYYDPSHAICQPNAPAYPRPGYGPWQNNDPHAPYSPRYGSDR